MREPSDLNETRWLVYCDWLEEHGRAAGIYIRRAVEDGVLETMIESPKHFVWTTQEREVIAIRDLETGHLKNCIRWLERTPWRTSTAWLGTRMLLSYELMRRGLIMADVWDEFPPDGVLPGRVDMCRRKTRDGNVYFTRLKARQEAERVRRATGDKVKAFECEVCHLWHIGKDGAE